MNENHWWHTLTFSHWGSQAKSQVDLRVWITRMSFHTGYRVSYTRRLHSVVIGPFTDIKYEVKALEIVMLLTVNVI